MMRKMKKTTQSGLLPAAALLAMLLTGCGSDSDGGLVTQRADTRPGVCVSASCDSDGDGLSDAQEQHDGTNPNDANDPVMNGHEDKDGDGLPNGLETIEGWDDNDANNPVDNGHEDKDGDGIPNGQETVEGWDDTDPDNPFPGGSADSDHDGFPAGLEQVEGWDDNDASNPVDPSQVYNATLVLDNPSVTAGMPLQASIVFKVHNQPGESFSTSRTNGDAEHVSWQVVDAQGNAVSEMTPTSEGVVMMPDAKTVTELGLVDQPLTLRAVFKDEGWFGGQADQEATFKVTLSPVSSTTIKLLKDGSPLAGNGIQVGDEISAQATVTLSDGSVIAVPSEASLGTWSVDQTGTDLGVTIDSVKGALNTDGVDTGALAGGVSFGVTWTGAGSLSGGSQGYSVTLSAPDFATVSGGACGGQLNDTSPTNAKGECLKIATADVDGKTLWFTSSPSIDMMEAMGYTVHDSENNEGTTYAPTYTESGNYGPAGIEFARFRQDGKNASGDGELGQFDRYCTDLATRHFAGKSDWRRPTTDELKALYNERGRMGSALGWPTNVYYWSSTPNVDTFEVYVLNIGHVSWANSSARGYASCVSGY